MRVGKLHCGHTGSMGRRPQSTGLVDGCFHPVIGSATGRETVRAYFPL